MGLLTVDARKMALKAMPVRLRSKPQAFCRNKEPRLPMLLPVKSRKPKRRLDERKSSQSEVVGKSFPRETGVSGDSVRAASSLASQANNPAIRIPDTPSSKTGARQPALSARQPV